ncbi:MAG: hypothetical protein QW757_03805 [Candidatus Woesearchaeota archaeon]
MSLHIKLYKSKRKELINVAISLIEYLDFKITYIKFNNKISNIEYIKKNIKSDEKFKLEIFFSYKYNNGFLEIHDNYHSKIFWDIEVDVFDNDFIVLLDEISFKKKLDKFCDEKKSYISRIIIDLNEEGDSNPLDVLYDYDSSGRFFFLNLIKVLEELCDENKNYEKIFEKIRISDKNYLVSRLWKNRNIKKYAFDSAIKEGIIAQEGSIKIYAKNKDNLKNYYKKLIDNILKPIFEDIPSIEDKIKEVSNNL